MKSSVQDEKFSKIKSKCCALKKNIFAISACAFLCSFCIFETHSSYIVMYVPRMSGSKPQLPFPQFSRISLQPAVLVM